MKFGSHQDCGPFLRTGWHQAIACVPGKDQAGVAIKHCQHLGRGAAGRPRSKGDGTPLGTGERRGTVEHRGECRARRRSPRRAVRQGQRKGQLQVCSGALSHKSGEEYAAIQTSLTLKAGLSRACCA